MTRPAAAHRRRLPLRRLLLVGLFLFSAVCLVLALTGVTHTSPFWYAVMGYNIGWTGEAIFA